MTYLGLFLTGLAISFISIVVFHISDYIIYKIKLNRANEATTNLMKKLSELSNDTCEIFTYEDDDEDHKLH